MALSAVVVSWKPFLVGGHDVRTATVLLNGTAQRLAVHADDVRLPLCGQLAAEAVGVLTQGLGHEGVVNALLDPAERRLGRHTVIKDPHFPEALQVKTAELDYIGP